MSSKTKSGLSETPPSKPSPATPRVSQLSRGVAKSESDSLSPLQSSRLSVDRSPRSINSKPTIDRRTPKVTRATPPEKPQTRVVKASELQVQLSHLQEDLKKTKEQLELIEKEKAQAIDELKQAKKAAEDANEKLQEAMVAQKRAEEDSEIEKFRAVELEQAGIEAAQKKEEEWQKELEDVRSQHALDVTALLSTTQELQRLKQELTMITDAKNQALSHADDATKIAEIHAEKVEILSSELTRLNVLLDSKLETEANESHKIVLQLKEEIDSLKQQLEKGKCFEDKLMEREAFIEQLNVDLVAAKMAESYARSLVEEWRNRVEELEMQAAEANKLERSASESLGSFMKELEANNVLLHDAETEMAALKEKVGLLEMTIRRQKGNLEESEHSLGMVKEEALFMEKKVESLMSELETVKEEKAQALNNEKLAASSVQSLLEEKNKVVTELENARDEEEKSKKAMESLASALHEVSVEAREAKERLVSNLVDHENYETQIEDLRLVLKATNEKYETVLDDAKHEIELLKKTVEESKNEFKNSKAMWDQKEENLVNSVRKSEEENISLEKKIDRLVNLQKQTEEEACGMRDEEAHLKDSLKEVEAEVISLQEALGEAKVESMKLKESLLVKENELQNIILENKELRTKEASSLEKVEELSKLLEEAMAKIQMVENGELTDSEKDYDLLPKMIEFSEENGNVREEKPKVEELPPQQTSELKTENAQEQFNGVTNEAVQMDAHKIENVNGKPKEDESKEKEDDSVEVEFKMWESCKIEKEQESFEEKVDSKVDGGESFDQTNGLSSTENVDDGGSSPAKQQQQKKKRPLLRKFGNLLKKGTSNQK
ncbi:PREDICTED: WEB family protein At3g02930, chloroplastic-like [Populus euphratica]|uniref:WEB family protein At3g02930, chloroplastic-like n=1 Tax=Populus euphratica TaxID=75702 RepID=A0AAJ6TIP1_POPEU|nr:PREDICTED: WEB family protein At3g02930, chloroplastic-like [Populus euphratica]